MKKMLAALLALMMLGSLALAEDGWPGESLGTMQVVNCQEWVSLRASPDASSETLARVPLGMWVSDCADAGNGFVRCEYDDGYGAHSGYILSAYLARAKFALCGAGKDTQGTGIRGSRSEFGGSAWTFADVQGAHMVYCERDYGAQGERLYVSCFDAGGDFAWGLCTESLGVTELNSTDAYLGGTADEPLALVHNFNLGLAAIDLASGRVRWTVDSGDVDLGAGQTKAVDEDGTLYVGGYYGPSPVAISKNGQVLWQSDAGYDAAWLYGLHIDGNMLAADYDAPDGDGYSRVVFDRATGAVLEAR